MFWCGREGWKGFMGEVTSRERDEMEMVMVRSGRRACMSSSQEAVNIEQRGRLLGHWTLASDLPNPPVTEDRVEKAQLPLASATRLRKRERRRTARSNSEASQVKATWPRQVGATVFGWRGTCSSRIFRGGICGAKSRESQGWRT